VIPEPSARLERVLLNGIPDQQLSPFDRAVHFGDGLFETIACRRGRPRFLSLHLERLQFGCTRLGIEAGNLSVNSHSSVRYWTPFGGFKSSGLGRELGPDAPFAFTETKNVFISTEG